MLNFRNINILFIGLVLLSVWADLSYGIPWFTYPALVLFYSLILFYGCYFVGSNFFIPIDCSARTTEKVIALSFDDGPDAANTPKVLSILQHQNARAAFFCIGHHIAGNEALLKQIADEGHLIGNHSFSHSSLFDLWSSGKMLQDMQRMDEAIIRVIGKKPKLFRPPYGVTNPGVKRAIISGNYIPVGWNIRSYDTMAKDEQKLLKRVVKRVKPGAVVLFHDTSEITVAILPAFIKYLKDNGYEITRLDKLLNLQAYV